ncbi:hypothetical protein DKP78_24800, partial [Enterococcus faecium]
ADDVAADRGGGGGLEDIALRLAQRAGATVFEVHVDAIVAADAHDIGLRPALLLPALGRGAAVQLRGHRAEPAAQHEIDHA